MTSTSKNKVIISNPRKKILLAGILDDVKKMQKISRELAKQYAPIIEQSFQPALDIINKYKDDTAAMQKSLRDFANFMKPKEFTLLEPVRRHETPLTKKDIESLQEKMVCRILKEIKQSKTKEKKTKLYLGDDNVFFRQPKSSYHCKLEGKIQIKILKKITHKFIDTEVLRAAVGSKTKEAVRKAIAIINKKARQFLKIEKLIESNRGKGYRLNPKYIVVA